MHNSFIKKFSTKSTILAFKLKFLHISDLFNTTKMVLHWKFIFEVILAIFLFLFSKESSLCIRKLFTENRSVKDCMLRLSSERTAPEGLILNFCVQTSPNFCTLCSIWSRHENKLLTLYPHFINVWKLSSDKCMLCVYYV